jgi:hypothetical protein
MTLDYQNELPDDKGYRQILLDFHSFYYLRLNQRRQEHLATLGLNLRRKKVWEVSAGIGDHTSFFLDRECDVTCSEVRPELLEILRHRFSGVRICELDLEKPREDFPMGFDVVYCYGVLYHLRTPGEALEFMAARSRDLLLLETCVSLGSELDLYPVSEPPEAFSQALSGIGCRPTRTWVFQKLQQLFPFVYVPLTQPDHEQFPTDWTATESKASFTRAIFVAARFEIDSPLLGSNLVSYQERR